MKKFIPPLLQNSLFAGTSEEELLSMLSCLKARVERFSKGAYIFRTGERVGALSILISGKLHIQKDDYWGNRSIINVVLPGELFGEAYAHPKSGAILQDVVAVEESQVIFLDIGCVLTVCQNGCQFHNRLVNNLFYILSEKNKYLVQKLGHMSKRTTREKLLSYLSEQSKKQGSPNITIPFNRQQLADFLSVDRSAMSNELCKMRDEGLLCFEKNRFELLSGHNDI
ncbi:MAG: Crp/Fnr family transcriptional regulator [Ruminococcaceae bacterium]|nr:Crp/Fnr family transcriptional regulator [Oscillospiraceae bacterium]